MANEHTSPPRMTRKQEAAALYKALAKQQPPPRPMFSAAELKEAKSLIAKAHKAGFTVVRARPEEVAWMLRTVRAQQ